MILFIVFLLLVLVALIIIFHERLTFPRGRLSRPLDRTTTESITNMGPDQFVELSFGTVHYIYHPGSSKLPLNIFVHGFSTPMEIWQDVFLTLVHDEQPCLVFDLYGRGWSDSPDLPMNVDIFVSQLTELLYTLHLPYETYNLLGVSMGGSIIQRFTELHPLRVSKLVLIASAGLKIMSIPPLRRFLRCLPIIGPIVYKVVSMNPNEKTELQQWAFPYSGQYEKYAALFRTGWQQHPGYLRALFSTLRNFNFEGSAKSIEFISKLNIPVLLIWGDRDTVVPVESAYGYHKMYKNSALTIIPNATHMILLEHAAQTAEAIKRFFQENN